MKFWRRNRRKKISNLERDLYLFEVDEIISNLSEEEQKILDYAKDFVNDWIISNHLNVGKTVIGPMDVRSFEFFIFAVIIEYEYQKVIKGL